MYDKKLEELIDAALEDGVLTEKEKQVLFKKAQAMGVDLDEFEMVLDARLVKAQKAEKEKAAQAQSAAPKSNKLGDVRKCPACGAMVQSFQGTCSECGYAFEDVQANLSSQKLAEAINKILEEGEKRKDKLRKEDPKFDSDTITYEIDTRIEETIKNFPIPNSKADLIEFITSLEGKTADYSNYGEAYKIKWKECIQKARILFPNDSLLQPMIQEIEKKESEKKHKQKKNKNKSKVIGIIILGIAAFLGYLIWVKTNWGMVWKIIVSFSLLSFSIPSLMDGFGNDDDED